MNIIEDYILSQYFSMENKTFDSVAKENVLD